MGKVHVIFDNPSYYIYLNNFSCLSWQFDVSTLTEALFVERNRLSLDYLCIFLFYRYPANILKWPKLHFSLKHNLCLPFMSLMFSSPFVTYYQNGTRHPC